MRDRLIKLLQEFADVTYSSNGYIVDYTQVDDVADHLLANGVIALPCKVGDVVYMPWQYNEVQSIACLKVTTMLNILGFGWSFGTDFNTDDEGYAEKYKYGHFEFTDIGKIVFLTREEAEKALAERSRNDRT
jgi:hypothetical protein